MDFIHLLKMMILNSLKHFINPLGTLSYQLQVEEMVNKKTVWEYGSKIFGMMRKLL